MVSYQKSQALEPIFWGTLSPVMLMLAGNVVQVRVRGNCSLVVIDPDNAEQSLPDPETITGTMRMLLANAAGEGLYTLSSSAKDANELSKLNNGLAVEIKQRVEKEIVGYGLGIQSIIVETIEVMP